jgi:plastocyanin
MVRRWLFVLAATTLAAIAVPAVPAAAGGGCHAGVSTGTGDTVEMRDACFTPTTLRIDPGGTVTFVNLDPITHNVGGNLWGHLDDMGEGDAFTATFDEAGIFPYACSYHPGMTGAVVVDDGTGAGNGELVSVASFDNAEEPEPPATRATSEAAAPSDGADVLGWGVAGVAGLAVGLGIGALTRRRATG